MLDKTDLQTLRGVLFQSDGFPFCFYGKFSRLGLDISIDGKLQIHIAEVNDSEAVPRTYNNDDRANFTITAAECYHIHSNAKEIMTGTWVDPKVKDEKYKNVFQITHFGDGSTSRLVLEPSKNGALKITIVPAKESGKKTLSYVLSYDKGAGLYERSIFFDFVKSVATTGPYNTQLFKSHVKALREMLRKQIDSDGKSTNNKYGSGTKTEEDRNQKPYKDVRDEPTKSYSGGEFDGYSDEVEEEIPF